MNHEYVADEPGYGNGAVKDDAEQANRDRHENKGGIDAAEAPPPELQSVLGRVEPLSVKVGQQESRQCEKDRHARRRLNRRC